MEMRYTQDALTASTEAGVYPLLTRDNSNTMRPNGDSAMENLDDIRKRIEELQESHGPDVLGRQTPVPPKRPTQPVEDEEEQPRRDGPNGPAGY